jgi:hypothetical protein
LAQRRAALREEAVLQATPLAARVRAAGGRPQRTRQEMLDRIARAEADPRFAGRIAAAAHGRRPDEPTDAELRALYETLVALGVIEDG